MLRRARSALAALLLFAAPALSGAQEAADSAVVPADFASPFLPTEHWTRGAMRRLEGMGLAPAGYVWGAHALTQRSVAIVLAYAAAHAPQRMPSAAPLVDSYRARFAEEFQSVSAALFQAEPRGLLLSGARASGGLGFENGRVRGGVGYPETPEFAGPTSIPDRSGLRVDAVSAGMLLPYAAFGLAGAHLDGEDTRSEVYATAAWRGAGIWVGRRQVGFGRGAGGGLVLNADAPLDGGGFFLTDPVMLPSFFRALGPMQFETLLARLDRSGTIVEPWFWSARGELTPHARVSLGLTRAVMFGGEGTTDISLRNLVFVLIGKHGGGGSEFENHIVSLDARYRPPLGLLPIELYVEWGLEDSAGAWKDVPGILAGAEIAAIPGVPQVSLAVERTSFAKSCCGNPAWYRHWLFTGSWAVDGTPLGHPLGGHGTEWRAHAAADLMDARLRLSADVFRRDRGDENLYAPERAGNSAGVAIAAELRAARALDVILRAATESGAADWRQSSGTVGLRFRF